MLLWHDKMPEYNASLACKTSALLKHGASTNIIFKYYPILKSNHLIYLDSFLWSQLHIFLPTFQVIVAQDHVFHLAILPSAAHRPDDGTQGEKLHPHLGGLEDPQVHRTQARHLSPLLMAYLSHLTLQQPQEASTELNITSTLWLKCSFF